MRAFEMFDYPIWCFDVEKKCMWWANKAALVCLSTHTIGTLQSDE
jgi:hypothetical protein